MTPKSYGLCTRRLWQYFVSGGADALQLTPADGMSVHGSAMVFDSNQLIDRVHEAGLLPSLWPAVLGELGDSIGGNGGILFAVREGYMRGVTSVGHVEALELFMQGEWNQRDQALKRAYALNHPGFVNDADLFTERELETDYVYRHFYRKHGLGYRAGTIIPMPIGDSIAIVMPRHHEDGPVPREVLAFLDGMRPHLARSALTANRLGFEKARAQAEALQALGIPGAVLRGRGRLFAANSLFEALMPSLFEDRMHRLVVADRTADALLADALETLPIGSLQVVRSIAVAATPERVPMVLHLVPVRGAAHDIFLQSTALLVVTPVDRAAVPTAEVLQGLFDLTPAEARVARGIGQAGTIDALAEATGVNRETVRSQLKVVLSKTGVSRQQELVRLLAGKALRSG
jgi:DNA-binding CsgD family transcriptional regulator